MIKEFIPYTEALALKELGFDEPCMARYSKKAVNNDNPDGFVMNRLGSWYKHNSGEINPNYLSAPLWQQAFAWIREKHNLDSGIVGCEKIDAEENGVKGTRGGYDFYISERSSVRYGTLNKNVSYNEARLDCLRELINTICNKPSFF